MKHNPQAVTTAMQLYFSGESLRKTAESLKLIGMDVTHQTIYNWIRKYIGLMQRYLEKIKPNVGEAWRTDELFLKIKGNMKYLYGDETRFWIDPCQCWILLYHQHNMIHLFTHSLHLLFMSLLHNFYFILFL
jgi:transposase-like protein